ncbi:hypothetical protein OIE62_07225 [Streptomyces scopuliridis]|uniref:Uncharacterized protein n=1 Tax=Streptomyces scopuliridis TaxID=452529 RepID=A0ACD4ZV18_9ACTN|nr:hypothetical protein [Streptomyces scopuliridis]WSC01633.1 hypothetical protein OG835_34595 [Streptomyces scopuliridis]WSC04828.1 hypothetical protein OIE62_07225 [Streptomyces scopuliridis]
MGDIAQQFQEVALLLDEVGALPPLSITFARDESSPYVLLATPHQLPLAEGRLAVDQIAALTGAVPAVGEVLFGRYAAWVRGQWANTVIIAATGAAHLPGISDFPERTTTTSDTAQTLRALVKWVGTAAPDVGHLVVADLSRCHSVYAMVPDDSAAQRVLNGLVPDAGYVLHRPGRRYRSRLPTGHLLTISVDPKRR